MSEADDLYREGVEAFRRGDYARSRDLNERSLALALRKATRPRPSTR
jgi:hypothetical protein